MPPPPAFLATDQYLTQDASCHSSTSVEKTAFINSLTQTPALYNLSRPDLENLVAHVVREEGFAKLVGTHLLSPNVALLARYI